MVIDWTQRLNEYPMQEALESVLYTIEAGIDVEPPVVDNVNVFMTYLVKYFSENSTLIFTEMCRDIADYYKRVAEHDLTQIALRQANKSAH